MAPSLLLKSLECFKSALLAFSIMLFIGCQNQDKTFKVDDLNNIKKNFLSSILESCVEESPFQMSYSLRTIFFSPDLVSLFGVVFVYDHLPHGWWKYEGKTFCRIQGKAKEIKLWELFHSMDQREFLRKYCEDVLKNDSISYFSGDDPLRTRLEYDDIRQFVIDDTSLIVVFQPYTVSGTGDGPMHIKVPYSLLKAHWNSSHPLPQLLEKILASKSYTASWEQENDHDISSW
jgi:hypothetical protein